MRLAILLLTFTINVAVSAQTPAPAYPWALPNLPVLQSPTPIPAYNYNSSLPETTPDPMATPTAFDPSGLQNYVATANAIYEATQETVDLNGTPVDVNNEFAQLGTDAATFIGYAKAVFAADYGKITPLIQFSATALVVVLSVTLLTFALPFIGLIIGVVRKAITLVLDFLPF